MRKYIGGPNVTRDEYQAIKLLKKMSCYNSNRLGAIILWNAAYHLAPGSGIIPSFNQQWAITKDVTMCPESGIGGAR